MRLTAQVASRLNQLRDTNLRQVAVDQPRGESAGRDHRDRVDNGDQDGHAEIGVQRLNLTGESLEPSLIHCELSCILIVENTNLITEGLDSLVEVSEIRRDGVGSAFFSSVDFVDARGQRDKWRSVASYNRSMISAWHM